MPCGPNVDDPFAHEESATPLSPEEREGLIPTYITTREQLNAAEQANILEAERWAFSRRRRIQVLLDTAFLFRLHKRMFGAVWRWAGEPRHTNKNIGVDWHEIAVALRTLVDDGLGWIQYGTYGADEFAVRFSHRLVTIHPFANGNGRHSRMMADLIVISLGGNRFSWGNSGLANAGDARSRYIAALKTADNHDYEPLLAFARS